MLPMSSKSNTGLLDIKRMLAINKELLSSLELVDFSHAYGIADQLGLMRIITETSLSN